MRQAVGVNVGLLVKGLYQFIRKVFVELPFPLQALALVFVETAQKLLVHEEPAVQHARKEQGGQAQGIEDFNAERAGRGVEDAQHRWQHHENDAGGKQAGGGPAQVVGDFHKQLGY